jgi:hypothetical protein
VNSVVSAVTFTKIDLPDNVSITLPPRSPALNPVENV